MCLAKSTVARISPLIQSLIKFKLFADYFDLALIVSFFKYICQTLACSSFLNIRICCFALPCMTKFWGPEGFGQVVEHKKQPGDIPSDSGKLWWQFSQLSDIKLGQAFVKKFKDNGNIPTKCDVNCADTTASTLWFQVFQLSLKPGCRHIQLMGALVRSSSQWAFLFIQSVEIRAVLRPFTPNWDNDFLRDGTVLFWYTDEFSLKGPHKIRSATGISCSPLKKTRKSEHYGSFFYILEDVSRPVIYPFFEGLMLNVTTLGRLLGTQTLLAPDYVVPVCNVKKNAY